MSWLLPSHTCLYTGLCVITWNYVDLDIDHWKNCDDPDPNEKMILTFNDKYNNFDFSNKNMTVYMNDDSGTLSEKVHFDLYGYFLIFSKINTLMYF